MLPAKKRGDIVKISNNAYKELKTKTNKSILKIAKTLKNKYWCVVDKKNNRVSLKYLSDYALINHIDKKLKNKIKEKQYKIVFCKFGLNNY